MDMVRHQNICMDTVSQVSAKIVEASYDDFAVALFSKEGLPVFDICSDEVREAFVGVAPKGWHTCRSETVLWSG